MLIRPGAIGDCLLSFPALEFLKAEYTEVWISSPVASLVQFANCVRTIASTQLDMVVADEVPKRLQERLRAFDEVVSWYGANRAEFRSAMEAVHPRCIFLRALPGDNWHDHACDFFLEQVGAPKGKIPKLDIDGTDVRGSVVIHPFSGGARKNWPLDCYRKMASRLSAPVEWTAGEHEPLGSAKRFDNLLALAHWMKGAAVYVGNDSGITHLAAAIGLPTVALFGPTEPRIWGPLGSRVEVLQHQPLSELALERVVESVRRLVA